MKRPSFQFYPADWRKDAALQSCSMAAQGLWMNLMCIAHECEPYGHLVVNGKSMTNAQISRLAGLSLKECDKLVAELEDSGVASRSEDGALFSRRMVKDENLRNVRAAGGEGGKEYGVLGAEHGKKGGRPPKVRGVIKPPLEPPPSSSSSSSSSNTNKNTPATPDGVAVKVWQDFLKIRKAKRAPMTETALQGIRTEADRAGYTLEKALQTCCERGWQGFDADWVLGKPMLAAKNGILAGAI